MSFPGTAPIGYDSMMQTTVLPKAAQPLPQPQMDADAEDFIRATHLESLVESAVRLAQEHLPLVPPMQLRLACDPDSTSQWIELQVSAAGDAHSIRAAHKQYTQAWLSLAPAERAFDVRLAIHLV